MTRSLDGVPRAIYTEQIAHVTFSIELSSEVEDSYSIYTQTKKDGKQLIEDGLSHDQALYNLSVKIHEFEVTLEHKRDGRPTQKQIMFLFNNKIPILPTLTWGDAHDLIDEHIAQTTRDKQARRLERFNGFTEGDRVSWTWNEITMIGHIIKLYQAGSAGKFALIETMDGSTYRFRNFDRLRKVSGEGEGDETE